MTSQQDTSGSPPLPDASPLLTAEEKRRIVTEIRLRQELLQELSAREAAPAEKKRSTLRESLNSPFVITIIGGAILALLGAYLQNHYAQIERDQAYVRTLRDKKYELFRTFAADLDFKLRCEGWLNNEQRRLDSAAAPQNSGFRQQLLQNYQNVFLIYIKIPQSSTYADQIKTLFPSSEVSTKMDILVEKMRTAVKEAGRMVERSDPSKSVEEAYYAQVNGAISSARFELYQAMQQDINTTRAPGQ